MKWIVFTYCMLTYYSTLSQSASAHKVNFGHTRLSGW